MEERVYRTKVRDVDFWRNPYNFYIFYFLDILNQTIADKQTITTNEVDEHYHDKY